MRKFVVRKNQLKDAPNKAGIYMLKWGNGKFYVGKSKDIRNRFRYYFNRGHHTALGQRLTAKYGQPKMTTLAIADSIQHLTELENHYINLFFNDPENINFYRAKEYKKQEYGPSQLKGRHKITVWASSAWVYSPVAFFGWSPIRNMLGITYGGKLWRRELVFARTKKDLRTEFLNKQKAWISRPHHYNNGNGVTWFSFEGMCFPTAKMALEYSLLPICLHYFQRQNFRCYYDYVHHSLQRSEVVWFDGLKFYGGHHAYLYAKDRIKIHYHWFLVYYLKVGAKSINDMKMIVNRPRNKGPKRMTHLFVKHEKKQTPCVSSYLVCHDGERWYCSISEAKRHNAKTLNFYYED